MKVRLIQRQSVSTTVAGISIPIVTVLGTFESIPKAAGAVARMCDHDPAVVETGGFEMWEMDE